MKTSSRLGLRLLCGAAAVAILAGAGAAQAEERAIRFEIPAQPLTAALNQFGIQSGSAVLFKADVTGAKLSRPLTGDAEPEMALAAMLDGTGLSYRRDGDAFVIVQGGSGDPQSGSAAGDGATVEALIVTAQKREEDIQDVPIAISAFTQEALEQQKIEGGFDLLKAIPNVTFSKNNFSSYNFSIRGIGTKAVSATTDPGVAVSFNNITLIQNRLFEQEYFDVERVEVLRGPQGTLYGRNATAGVINVITAKPDMNDFDGWLKGEVGNYHTKRVSAMVNVPLISDKLALRFAGALTSREGYDFNEGTNRAVNGRDLWSGRVTVAFAPVESVRGNLIWERFNEDDNRSRTGKQLCHRDPGLTEVGGVPVPTIFDPAGVLWPALFSTGCKAGSLYDEAAFSAPNGLALPFVFGLIYDRGPGYVLDPVTNAQIYQSVIRSDTDPYAGLVQSKDLRTISSLRDPVYRAKADLLQLNVEIDLTPDLTLDSQTAYNKDSVYSFQDYNRFNSNPIFTDTAGWFAQNGTPSPYRTLAPGGIFCDPQIGCSNKMAGFDISQASAEQFTQDIRIASNFDGPINFSAGVGYTQFKVDVDYYVMYNLITAFAMLYPFNQITAGYPPVDFTICGTSPFNTLPPPGLPSGSPGSGCPYIDPNPVESINGEGHNYFRSKNPYKLKSGAAFGELYWNPTDTLKVTAGLRYNTDRKIFTPVPSQVLLAESVFAVGRVNRGYPELPDIKQHWGEWTGRLGVDWQPALSFTDNTLLYAFYSRGYKGGGANPPQPGFNTETINEFLYRLSGMTLPFPGFNTPMTSLRREYGDTFRPEFVNAYEVGAKNTLLGGALTLNGSAFFYDYKDYQVSQIRDRTAVNENFDAKVWGLEFQGSFSPTRNLQIIGNLGYLDTRIGDGMKSIDVMNRTQDDPNYVVVKPWVQLPSNCIAPVSVVSSFLDTSITPIARSMHLCGGYNGFVSLLNAAIIDPSTGAPYDPYDYPEINGGLGKWADLGGNELPNSPHWTANLGAQYGLDILADWRVTIRGDAYWQSQSWARVYNRVNDKLHGWYNVNLSVWFERPDDDLKIELYAKNLLDKTPITDAFLNSDDTALTTNVFVLDPRLIGLSIRKGF